jgi:hypothetical protein
MCVIKGILVGRRIAMMVENTARSFQSRVKRGWMIGKKW